MKQNTIPKTKLEVSQISFGCMSLEGTDIENGRLLHKAMDSGINYFDTADLYDKGRNEETVGKALQDKRDAVIIATKVGNEWNPDGKSWRWNPNKEYILQAINKSLKRLQTNYIDIYQLHGGTIDDPIDDVIEAFELLKKKGKIRAYGISSIRPNVIREYTSRSNIISNMMQYSLLDRRPEETMLDHLKDHDIAMMVRGGLAKGLLVNKDPRDYLGHSTEYVKQTQARVQELAKAHQLSSAQMALHYVLHHQTVTTAVVGFRTEDQLEDVVNGFENNQLDDELYQQLKEQLVPKVYENHR